MRIVGGDWRGRKLETPKGDDVRPTTDMVKESMFNIVQFEVAGARVLDLFCGTGQLGLEALSRGAERCVFVDTDRDSIELTRRNIEKCGASDRAEVTRGDAIAYLERAKPFDIVLLDPPYGTGLLEKALNAIITFDILTKDGIILCESRADEQLSDAPPPYTRSREYRYGKIKLTTFRKG
jgi:16S rRNA (guanine(966)-N(2))-methyltransferase RsmD